jgi:hypothetical protein
LTIVGVLFALGRTPRLADDEAALMAGRFAFDKLPLAEQPGRAHQIVRRVHPSLEHLSAQISFVGAAAALGDLDGDGLPNDLVSVDPRTDLVVAAPVPGTGRRYAPFALHPSPLPYDAATTAPMGSLLGDFNEDGLLDVLVYYWGRSPTLFLRRANGDGAAPGRRTFETVELVEPPCRWYTSACTQADLDGDGHADLIVGNYFPDDARILDAGAAGSEQMPDSISRAFNGGKSRLFLAAAGASRAGGRLFREIDHVLSDDVARGWTLAVGAADLDGDLLPEIYFAQDWGPDRWLHNRSRTGRPEFALLHGERGWTTPSSKVAGRDTFGGMGIDFGDLNGDGWLDLFVSNITCDFGLHESHFLFLSTGETRRMREGVAPYRDASEAWGLSRSGWAWEAKLADFDNDGVLEAVQAAGFAQGAIDRWPEYQETAVANDRLIRDPRTWPRLRPGDHLAGDDTTPFFVRAADGRYYDLARSIGLAEPMTSRGIAIGDVDGDGRLDFALANQWRPSFFFRNRAPQAGEFLGLCLRLPLGVAPPALVVRPGHPDRRRDGPSRAAIGAAARVYLPDGRRLAAQVDGGNGHSGKRSPELHFGLGRVAASETLRVELHWRDAAGEIRRATLRLSPGWHTVMLGRSGPKDAGQ